MAGVQAATEMLFVRLQVPADWPAKLFRGAGSALAPQPWGLEAGEKRPGTLGTLFGNSVDLVRVMPLAKLRVLGTVLLPFGGLELARVG